MDATTATPRARAMWGYSGLDQGELAKHCEGIGYHRLRAILSPSDMTEVSLEELHAIADAVGAPRWFAERGFIIASENAEPGELAERVSQLEQSVEDAKARAAVYAAEVSAQFERMTQTMFRLQSQQRP